MNGRKIYTLCFSAVLTAFTAYAVLDTFVIPRSVRTADSANISMFDDVKAQMAFTEASEDEQEEQTAFTETSEQQEEQTQAAQQDIIFTDDTYSDGDISVKLTEYYENNTKIYVADIQLSSAEYLKSAFAEDSFGRNITEKTSYIAQSNDAVLAVNGDYYGARETGYVIRNGIAYRDSSDGEEILCLYADGTMKIVDSGSVSADELVSDGVWQAWDFGPALIRDNEICVSEGQEVGRAMASNPRTAVGMIDKLHYVFVVSDGRTSESEGLSLSQLAEFMKGLGVTTAYNLDGGGSSTMWFGGRIINNPTTSGRSVKERSVSDIVYIGK